MLLAGAAALAGGCFEPEPILPEQLERGYILLLPGVKNADHSMADTIRGLRDAGVDHAIELRQWGEQPVDTFRYVSGLQRNREEAEQIAAKLAEYRQDHADQPVTVMGYSGGGAMALFVAEALPDEVMLDRIILLGPTISPEYDLAPALAHCRGGLVNFYCQRDWFMGGLATQEFGTMDRQYTSAAGSQGFRDQQGQPASCDGLTQIAWTPEWYRLGHKGHHFGWLSRQWAREILAPQIDPAFRAVNDQRENDEQ